MLADDLGYNEVEAYGQTNIKTPNLDRRLVDLAAKNKWRDYFEFLVD